MNIFEQTQELHLPLGEYVIISSGVMSAHGIREHKDIDLLVTKNLYDKLKNEGWETEEVCPGFEVIKSGIFEASPDILSINEYHPDVTNLIKNAEIINGVAFTPLNEVIEFKKALGREKDKQDIILIKEYLKNKN